MAHTDLDRKLLGAAVVCLIVALCAGKVLTETQGAMRAPSPPPRPPPRPRASPQRTRARASPTARPTLRIAPHDGRMPASPAADRPPPDPEAPEDSDPEQEVTDEVL